MFDFESFCNLNMKYLEIAYWIILKIPFEVVNVALCHPTRRHWYILRDSFIILLSDYSCNRKRNQTFLPQLSNMYK